MKHKCDECICKKCNNNGKCDNCNHCINTVKECDEHKEGDDE